MQLENKVLLLIIKAQSEQWKENNNSKDLEELILLQTLR